MRETQLLGTPPPGLGGQRGQGPASGVRVLGVGRGEPGAEPERVRVCALVLSGPASGQAAAWMPAWRIS